MNKKIIIIAGPNGAGKTAFAHEYLPKEGGCPVFINADLIAKGLSPFEPDTAAVLAGRLMLQAIDHYTKAGQNFSFETTLSGRGYLRKIERWRADGYRVKLFFLSLTAPEKAVHRVGKRVARGGHGIPEATIRRRFDGGLKNFEIYRDKVDFWQFYDNNGGTPILIDQGETMANQIKEPPVDEDPQRVLDALIRARNRAHLVAHWTGTNVVIAENGESKEIPPNPKYYNAVKDRRLSNMLS